MADLAKAYETGLVLAEDAKKHEAKGDLVSAAVLLHESVSALLHVLSLETDDSKRKLVSSHVAILANKARDLDTQNEKASDSNNSRRSSSASTPEAESERIARDIKLAAFFHEQAEVTIRNGNAAEARKLYINAAELYIECGKALKENQGGDSPKSNEVNARAGRLLDIVTDLDKSKKNSISSNRSSSNSRSPVARRVTSVVSSKIKTGATALQAAASSLPVAPNGVVARSAGGKDDDAKDSRMTKEEKDVLKRSSVINGRLFVPWLDTDLAEPLVKRGSGLYCDPDGLLALSDTQKKQFGAWKRPSEFMKGKVEPKMVHTISHFTINQELVTDCSFVSSLCITASYERRFDKQLITNIIYPQDRNGVPVYNPYGKYMVRLWFNGVARRVIVDDRLPVSKSGKLICSYSTNPGELWVSIIEKAYMKLNGGYDFPGSNSGIDLYALTGWIPETIQTKDLNNGDQAMIDSTWANLYKGTRYGDVLCTVATSTLDEATAKRLGLVPSHAYAVLDVREVNGIRLLQLKNPWAHLRWKGPFSPHDTVNWTPELKAAVQYDQFRDMQFDNGIFWIDLPSLLRFFGGLYMNWSFELLPYKIPVHRYWDHRIGPAIDTYNVGYNPQFSLEVTVPTTSTKSKDGTFGAPKSAVVWVVISRHVTNKAELLSTDDSHFIAVHVYDKRKGKRVYYPVDPLVKGKYSNNPHGLVSFEAPPGKNSYTLVPSLFEKKQGIDFTLTVYTHAKARMRQLPRTKVFIKTVRSEWTKETAGGSGRNGSFMFNPQWRMSLKTKSRVICRLEAPKDMVINIRLLQGGERVCSVAEAVEVVTSGDYHRGFRYFESPKLPIGDFTIAVSTYEPGQCSAFVLHVESDGAFDLAPIPQEGDSSFRSVIAGTWDNSTGNAAGCANYGNYHQNPRISVTIPDGLTRVRFRIQADPTGGGSSSLPSVNAAMFAASEDGSLSRTATPATAMLTTNKGVYSNPPAGKATKQMDVKPGKYIIVPSTFKPRNGKYRLYLYTSKAIPKPELLD